MVWLDSRLPIRFGTLDSRAAGEAVVTDGAAPGEAAAFDAVAFDEEGGAGHAAGCACCLPRSGAATALALLFRTRATSAAPAFRGVLAVVGPAGAAAIREAVAKDPLVGARFRLAAGG